MSQINRPAENKMGVLPIGKLLAGMALPMMLSMMVQALYNIVDSIFVAMISENALTAVSLAFPLQNLMIAVATGTGVGVNALLSRSLGAKEQEKADRAANVGIFLALCAFVVFAVLGGLFSRLFFTVQTDVAEIVDMGTTYGRICLCCSIGLFCQIMFERLLQSTGRMKLAMTSQITGAVINMCLDPIFIFVLNQGVRGAAIATVIGQCVAALIGLTLNLKKNTEIHIDISKVRYHAETVRTIYSIGLPSIIMVCIGSLMTFCLNRILIGFTTTATAVFGAYFKLQSFIFMPIFGLNNAMVPIISYNFGARKPERVWRTVKLAISMAVCIMAVGTLLFELIPGTLLSIFSPSDTMLAIGIPALRIIGIHFIMAAFCVVSGSVCQAIGNPMYSMITSICRQLVVLLPVAFLMSLTGRLELVWFSYPIAEVVSLTLSAIFLVKTYHRASAVMSSQRVTG